MTKRSVLCTSNLYRYGIQWKWGADVTKSFNNKKCKLSLKSAILQFSKWNWVYANEDNLIIRLLFTTTEKVWEVSGSILTIEEWRPWESPILRGSTEGRNLLICCSIEGSLSQDHLRRRETKNISYQSISYSESKKRTIRSERRGMCVCAYSTPTEEGL